MVAAIDKYRKERQSAAATGKPIKSHHRLAIGPALALVIDTPIVSDGEEEAP